MAGAGTIYAIDLNKGKFEIATKLGATDCVCPTDFPEKTIQQVLVGMSPTGFGIDYTFDW